MSRIDLCALDILLHRREISRSGSAAPFTPELVCAAVCGLSLCLAGWHRGEAVRRRRKAAGLPSVDATLMTQHDRFNLLTLVRQSTRPATIIYTCLHADHVAPDLSVLRFCLQPVLVVMGVCVAAEYLGLNTPSVDVYLYTVAFTLYVAVDLVYVWIVPESTPQPGVILIHHVWSLSLPLLANFYAISLLSLCLRTQLSRLTLLLTLAGCHTDVGSVSAAQHAVWAAFIVHLHRRTQHTDPRAAAPLCTLAAGHEHTSNRFAAGTVLPLLEYLRRHPASAAPIHTLQDCD